MDYILRDIPFQFGQVVLSALAAGLWTLVACGGWSRRTTRGASGCGCRMQRLRRFSLVTAIVSQLLALLLWWGTGVLFLPTVGASVMLTVLYLGTECRERTAGDVCVHEQRVFGRVVETVPTPASHPGSGSH